MEKLQNKKSNGIKLKWREPGLIDLTRARQRARGLCIATGSGDFDDCLSNGLSALGDCIASGAGFF